MTVMEATRLGREALLVTLMVGGPALIAIMVVGTVVSLFQAVTQVHEATLTFLPKLLVISLVLALASGWMARELVNFGERCFRQIPEASR